MISLFQTKEIYPDTWMITEGEGRGATHCYLLVGNVVALLIDTGLGTINLKNIVDDITCKPICVINTHGHIDHISNNYEFEKVFLSEEDEKIFLEHSSYEFRYRFFKQRFMKKGCSSKALKTMNIKEKLEQLSMLPRKQNREYIFDNQWIDLGNRTVQIIKTPGHTLGSLCILDKVNHAIYTGDSVCEEGVLLNFAHSTSVSEYKESLLKLKSLSNPTDNLYSGHQKTPLPVTYLDEYINCCNSILDQSNVGIEVENVFGNGRLSTMGQATITYCSKGEIYE